MLRTSNHENELIFLQSSIAMTKSRLEIRYRKPFTSIVRGNSLKGKNINRYGYMIEPSRGVSVKEPKFYLVYRTNLSSLRKRSDGNCIPENAVLKS